MHQHIHGVVKRTGANEFAGIHKKDFIGILDGIQPVGNDYARSGGR